MHDRLGDTEFSISLWKKHGCLGVTENCVFCFKETNGRLSTRSMYSRGEITGSNDEKLGKKRINSFY